MQLSDRWRERTWEREVLRDGLQQDQMRFFAKKLDGAIAKIAELEERVNTSKQDDRRPSGQAQD